MVFAAIDIGSNAIRLLFSRVYNVDGKPHFNKEELIRMPIRLGEDVFLQGRITDAKADRLVTALKGYAALIKAYGVDDYRAVATSAMRDATNGAEIIERVRKEADLLVEIIDGKNEAALLFSNHIEELLNPKHAYLYIDVGGGSTELTLYFDNKVISAKSFNIGTVRMLLDKVEKDEWEEMKAWLKRNTVGIHPLHAIGSGGNINKIFSLSKRKEGKSLNIETLKDYYKEFSSLSVSQRMVLYKLREDRADVIVPALLIYLNVMRWAGAEEIFVPKIGLADGLIHILYDRVMKKEKSQ